MKDRKTRKTETRRYEVRWLEFDRIYMRWFCRPSAATKFAESLQHQGYEVLVARW